MDNKKLLNNLLLFLSFILILQVFFNKPAPQVSPSENNLIEFKTTKEKYSIGKTIGLKITNNSNYTLVFKSKCPSQPFQVSYLNNGETLNKEHTSPIDCQESIDPSAQDLTIPSHKTKTLNYTYWSSSLFNQEGQYKISANLKIKDETIHVESGIFQIKARGFIGKFWLSSFYQPIYNAMILLLMYLPGTYLGLAIITLTLILRFILFIPSQKALKSQKTMANIQPQLNAVKEKYKDDQQKIASETMKIWKANNVSPASSCLPMLVQFPILIALFYVIKDVLNPDKTYLIYNFLSNFQFSSISTHFLGFNLAHRSLYILPVIVGGLQFFQLQQMQNKKKTNETVPTTKKEDKKSETESMQNMMQYFMPVMIAVFTSSMPAGVGLYWGTSTLFSIGQQFFINNSEEDNTPQSRPSKSPKRKKINPKKITTIKI